MAEIQQHTENAVQQERIDLQQELNEKIAQVSQIILFNLLYQRQRWVCLSACLWYKMVHDHLTMWFVLARVEKSLDRAGDGTRGWPVKHGCLGRRIRVEQGQSHWHAYWELHGRRCFHPSCRAWQIRRRRMSSESNYCADLTKTLKQKKTLLWMLKECKLTASIGLLTMDCRWLIDWLKEMTDRPKRKESAWKACLNL